MLTAGEIILALITQDASFEEWLKYLQWYNDKARSWHETLPIDLGSLWQPVDLLTPPFVFDVAFKWCQQLKQPMGVSYRTVEIYERFARSYCCQSLHLKTTVVGSINLKTSCKMRWQEFCMEMRHQSLLHLVSCLQIASKLENGYKVGLFIFVMKTKMFHKYYYVCSW